MHFPSILRLAAVLALLPIAACGRDRGFSRLELASTLHQYQLAQVSAPRLMSPSEGAAYADSLTADPSSSAGDRADASNYRLPQDIEVVTYHSTGGEYYLRLRDPRSGVECHYDSQHRLGRSTGVHSVRGSYCGKALPAFGPAAASGTDRN